MHVLTSNTFILKMCESLTLGHFFFKSILIFSHSSSRSFSTSNWLLILSHLLVIKITSSGSKQGISFFICVSLIECNITGSYKQKTVTINSTYSIKKKPKQINQNLAYRFTSNFFFIFGHFYCVATILLSRLSHI